MTMNRLYRGISKIDDDRNKGKLLPKGKIKELTLTYSNAQLKYNDKFTYGASIENTARAHQIDSAAYNGCSISTTRRREIAEKFATSGNIEDGFVYVIDEDKLSSYDITKCEFDDPENPKEQEVTLILNKNSILPNDVIVEKYKVKCKS